MGWLGKTLAFGRKKDVERPGRRVPARLGGEEGIGTLEVVLIAAVVIVLVILFKDWITDFLSDLFRKVENEADQLF